MNLTDKERDFVQIVATKYPEIQKEIISQTDKKRLAALLYCSLGMLKSYKLQNIVLLWSLKTFG